MFFEVVVVLEPSILNKWASENKSGNVSCSKNEDSLENLKTLFFKGQEAFVFISYFYVTHLYCLPREVVRKEFEESR